MWKVFIFCIGLLLTIYYITVVLKAFSILNIGDKPGYKMMYLIPFYMWWEK